MYIEKIIEIKLVIKKLFLLFGYIKLYISFQDSFCEV